MTSDGKLRLREGRRGRREWREQGRAKWREGERKKGGRFTQGHSHPEAKEAAEEKR